MKYINSYNYKKFINIMQFLNISFLKLYQKYIVANFKTYGYTKLMMKYFNFSCWKFF